MTALGITYMHVHGRHDEAVQIVKGKRKWCSGRKGKGQNTGLHKNSNINTAI
jgi:hypothetical protein